MLGRLNISTKIISAILLVSMIGLVISVYSAMQMKSASAEYSYLIKNRDAGVAKLIRANRAVNQAAYAAFQVMAYDDAATMNDAAERYKEKMGDLRTFLADAAGLMPEEATNIGQLGNMVEAANRAGAEAVRRSIANDDDAAMLGIPKFDEAVKVLTSTLSSLNDRLRGENEARAAAMETQVDTTITMSLAGTFAGMILGVGVALFVSTKGITGPIKLLAARMGELAGGRLDVPVEGQERRDEVGIMAKAVQVFKDAASENKRLAVEAAEAQQAQVAQRDRQSAIDGAKAEDLRHFVHAVEAGFDALSAGDLTVRMHQAVAPEFEPIRAKFNDSVAALEDTIGSVVAAVGSMRTGLNEITVAASDLSQRTEQQAASLEETVAALAEVTRGINATAGDALKAHSTATIALRNAEKGGTVVAQAVEAMSQIEQSSEQIGKIIGVIDEIAFQTNLLALNAGVEAARAGEAGRGFAVVAQEVRGLAQRSAEAAKEIKSLIATSSAQVGQGVELVVASGKSLEDILAQVAGMSETVSVIANSSSEQSLSLKEVSAAADQMDKVTQQNAAMVEETTAAAQNLLGETDELAALIQRFRTTNAVAGRASSARAPVKMAARPSHRPVAQMRTTGSARAAPKAAPASETWEDF